MSQPHQPADPRVSHPQQPQRDDEQRLRRRRATGNPDAEATRQAAQRLGATAQPAEIDIKERAPAQDIDPGPADAQQRRRAKRSRRGS